MYKPNVCIKKIGCSVLIDNYKNLKFIFQNVENFVGLFTIKSLNYTLTISNIFNDIGKQVLIYVN